MVRHMVRAGLSRISGSAIPLAVVGALFITVLAVPASAAEVAIELPGDQAIASTIAVEQAMLDLTNADRVANGLGPLDFDPETLAIARQRAASQLDTPSLSHLDANGELAFVNLLAAAQIGYELAGENLARTEAHDAAVTDRVEQALMKSPLHRKNILDKGFNRVAIGAADNGNGELSLAEVYRN